MLSLKQIKLGNYYYCVAYKNKYCYVVRPTKMIDDGFIADYVGVTDGKSEGVGSIGGYFHTFTELREATNDEVAEFAKTKLL